MRKIRLPVILLAVALMLAPLGGLAEGGTSRLAVLEAGFDTIAAIDQAHAVSGVANVEGPLPVESVVVASISEGLMMLQSGRVDSLSVVLPTAEYLAATMGNVSFLSAPVTVSLHIVSRQGEDETLALLNEAIAAMRADGTIDSLYGLHVDQVIAGNAPEAIDIAKVEGAPTLVVGVSGDMPPIDYVTADGSPAGFNTALLSALSARAGMNIEILHVSADARFAALASGKIDAFFWQMQIAGVGSDTVLPVEDLPENKLIGDFVISDSYWDTPLCMVTSAE